MSAPGLMTVAKLSDAQYRVPTGYITHSKTAYTSSIAAHNSRAVLNQGTIGALTNGLLNVPGIAGKFYTLIGIIVTNKSTLTTLVPTGGLLEVFNDAIDWVPMQILFNVSSAVGANAGASQSPTFIPVNKPLPAGSNIYAYYTSQNAATDWLSVNFVWSTQPYFSPGGTPFNPQTFIAYAYGTSRSSAATFIADGTVTIPANKGGNLVGFLFQCYAQVTTVLSSGGVIITHNAAANTAYEPSEFTCGSNTSIGTGGSELFVMKVDYAGDCPGNSVFTFDWITISADTQQMGYCVVWEA